jgi:hypothetical protein
MTIMTNSLAVDIALLPPDDVMDASIAINKKLLENQPSVLALSKSSRLPHITLMQAIIREDDLAAAGALLKQIAGESSPISLQARLISANETTSFGIHVTDDLQNLHEVIMNRFEGLVSYGSDARYYDDKEVRQRTIDYVRDFRAKAAFANFNPHITLGIGALKDTDQSISFKVQRLAICHLGNFNTCKRILYETRL